MLFALVIVVMVTAKDSIGHTVAIQPTLAKCRNLDQIVCKECWVSCVHKAPLLQ